MGEDCAYHPGVSAVGQHVVRDEEGLPVDKIGLCLICVAETGLTATGKEGALFSIARGAPCLCGPGFCANEHGVGFYGGCAGKSVRQLAPAPDCAKCGASHQSTAGCWLCFRNGSARTEEDREAEAENTAVWLDALRAGVGGLEIFAEQDAARKREEYISFREALEAAVQAKAKAKAEARGE